MLIIFFRYYRDVFHIGIIITSERASEIFRRIADKTEYERPTGGLAMATLFPCSYLCNHWTNFPLRYFCRVDASSYQVLDFYRYVWVTPNARATCKNEVMSVRATLASGVLTPDTAKQNGKTSRRALTCDATVRRTPDD